VGINLLKNVLTDSNSIGVESVNSKDKVQPDEQATSLRIDSVKEEIVTNEGE